VYKRFKNYNQPDEKLLIQKFKKDENLPMFVQSNLKYSRIEYDKDTRRAFVRACIDNQIILNYEQERIKEIVKKITKYREGKGFDELERSTGGKTSNDFGSEKDPFKELDESFK
jgi:hypothetical protein